MTAETTPSPALIAAREADSRMEQYLRDGENFLLEAGAGAGKTYSLIEALRFLISHEGDRLRRGNQRVACITYTNAATAVINSRIDGDPLVFTDTVHAFCWSLIKGFQPTLRREIATLPVWQERIAAGPPISAQVVEYDLGFRKLSEDVIAIHHDDVLAIAVNLLPLQKFQAILAAKFPFILIDEYQDTNIEFMEALKGNIFSRNDGPQVGLFGDHWQRIYDSTCGHVAHAALAEVGKNANFRSATSIVKVLNNMRPALPQEFKDEGFVGSAVAFHTNGWVGTRRTGAGGGHWTGDLPADVAHRTLEAFIGKLKQDGWDFEPEKTKILMLTHNVLAAEQGYANLAKVFQGRTEQFIKKENDHIAFFADRIEPACDAYSRRRYGEMFELLGDGAPPPRSHADKVRWTNLLDELNNLRTTGTIGGVIDLIGSSGFLRLPEGVARREADASTWDSASGIEMPEGVRRIREMRFVAYSEMIALDRFIDGHTPFATKHSVKGDEFENVLVVLGRGWNHYNFNQFLELAAAPDKVPADKHAFFDKNRNLFYVSCSRPTTRLALLFTQQLSPSALQTLQAWFGAGAVSAFSPPSTA